MDLKPHKITVCGGGNGAQTLVPIAARNLGCAVDVYAPFADEAARLREASAAHDGIGVTGVVEGRAMPRRISADPAEVIPGSEVLLLVLPAFAHESTVREIVPYLEEGAWVGSMPARGGFDYCAHAVLRENGRGDVGLFGLQTLPWACRILEYGRVVHVLGTKQVVDVATRPAAEGGNIAELLARMLGMSINPATTLMALTLANTGQLIHPGIMYALFGEWDGTPLDADKVPPFYHSLNQRGADILAGLSEEIQAIRARLEPALDLSAVLPLREWLVRSYGHVITDASTLRSAFVTNQAYARIKSPVRQVAPGKVIPDLRARYLAEDVPFGLAVSRAIARLAGVATPVMDEVITWAGHCLGADYLQSDAGKARIPQQYGLETLARLIAFATERT